MDTSNIESKPTLAHVENFSKVSRLPITSPTEFFHEKTKSLFDWWATFQPHLPTRKDFKIEEHWTAVPNLYLIKYLGQGEFNYSLNGENVIDLVGKNQAGTRFDIHGDKPELTTLATYLMKIVSSKNAMRCFGTLDFLEKGSHSFESVDCPLSDKKGNITHIIGILLPTHIPT